LYKRALLPDGDPAKIFNLTGVSDVFELPASADLVLDTHIETPEQSAGKLAQLIRERFNSLNN
jgi:adenylylsulfate kinase